MSLYHRKKATKLIISDYRHLRTAGFLAVYFFPVIDLQEAVLCKSLSRLQDQYYFRPFNTHIFGEANIYRVSIIYSLYTSIFGATSQLVLYLHVVYYFPILCFIMLIMLLITLNHINGSPQYCQELRFHVQAQVFASS